MIDDNVYEGLVEAKEQLVVADGLIEEAVGWLSDIMAEDSTRDGEPPTGKEIAQWTEDWLAEANKYLNGENNE